MLQSININRQTPQMMRTAVLWLCVFATLSSSTFGDEPSEKPKKLPPPRTQSAAIVLTSVILPVYGNSSGSFVTHYGVKRRELEHVQLLSNVRQVVPFREIDMGVRYFDRSESVRLIGTTETAIDVTRLRMQSGRFFKKKELLTRNNVIVIGKGLANTLLRGIDPVGENLLIGNRYYLIIGVTSSQQKPGNGLEVYLPITTMKSMFGDLHVEIVRSAGSFSADQFETSYVVVTVKNQTRRDQTAEHIREILKRFHEKKKDYTVRQTSGTTGR